MTDNTVVIGCCTEGSLSEREANLLFSVAPNFSRKYLVYRRALICQHPYCSEAYRNNLKTRSFSILLHNQGMARIGCFVVDPETKREMYMISKLYQKHGTLPFINSAITYTSHVHIVSLTNTIIMIQQHEIVCKIVFLGKLRGSEEHFIVAQQPNSCECD